MIRKEKPSMELEHTHTHTELPSPLGIEVPAAPETVGSRQEGEKEGDYLLIKGKLDALSSENSFSIKFPKKNPLAGHKHWKSFQMSPSLSVSLPAPLPLCLFWKLRQVSNVYPKAVYTEADGASD